MFFALAALFVLGCQREVDKYFNFSKVRLRWEGVPAQEAFGNPELLKKLLENSGFKNVVAQIDYGDLRHLLDADMALKQLGIKVENSREAFLWVKEHIKTVMKKSGVIESNAAILKSKTAVCIGKAQLLASIMISLKKNARVVVGTYSGKGHAWVQEYDQEGNIIGFFDPTWGIYVNFSLQTYKEVVEKNIKIFPAYRHVFSFDNENMWIHGE